MQTIDQKVCYFAREYGPTLEHSICLGAKGYSQLINFCYQQGYSRLKDTFLPFRSPQEERILRYKERQDGSISLIVEENIFSLTPGFSQIDLQDDDELDDFLSNYRNRINPVHEVEDRRRNLVHDSIRDGLVGMFLSSIPAIYFGQVFGSHLVLPTIAFGTGTGVAGTFFLIDKSKMMKPE